MKDKAGSKIIPTVTSPSSETTGVRLENNGTSRVSDIRIQVRAGKRADSRKNTSIYGVITDF